MGLSGQDASLIRAVGAGVESAAGPELCAECTSSGLEGQPYPPAVQTLEAATLSPEPLHET